MILGTTGCGGWRAGENYDRSAVLLTVWNDINDEYAAVVLTPDQAVGLATAMRTLADEVRSKSEGDTGGPAR